MSTPNIDTGQIHVGFDGFSWPIEQPVVVIHAEHGPVQGAGITWSTVEGRTVLSVEFQMRGREPLRIHLTEQDDGTYEISLPPLNLGP